MIFVEPPPTQADIHFVLFGIPVRIHPMFWLTALLLGYNQPLVAVLLWIAALFVAILIHELGHAVVMRSYGSYPHIVLHWLGGLAIPDGGYRRRPGYLGNVFISAAGPGAGFLLAAGLCLGLIVAGLGDRVFLVRFWQLPIVPQMFWENFPRFSLFLNDVFFVSVFWGLINLLPVLPLDGGHIAQELFVRFRPRDGLRQSLALSTVTAGVMAAIALLQWHSLLTGLFFGYLAYSSFLQYKMTG